MKAWYVYNTLGDHYFSTREKANEYLVVNGGNFYDDYTPFEKEIPDEYEWLIDADEI